MLRAAKPQSFMKANAVNGVVGCFCQTPQGESVEFYSLSEFRGLFPLHPPGSKMLLTGTGCVKTPMFRVGTDGMALMPKTQCVYQCDQ